MILCFGDSLTAGFQAPTREHPTGLETPYGHFLQELLGERVPVQVRGVCGELTGEMATRFRREVLQARPNYVVILGGTNDLGWQARPSEVMRNLLKMYELARAESIIPVPVTVPSIRVETGAGGPEVEEFLTLHLRARKELNGLIQAYADSKGLACLDLFSATAEPSGGQLMSQYSNDGLHLTTAGYRLMAERLYEQVFAKAFPAVMRGGT